MTWWMIFLYIIGAVLLSSAVVHVLGWLDDRKQARIERQVDEIIRCLKEESKR